MILKEGLSEEGEFSININVNSKTSFQIDRFDLLIVLVSNSFAYFHFGSRTFSSNGRTSGKLGQRCVPFGHPWSV